ncbi:VanZ family protein [Anaerolineales bacterium HSG24]|nr:VanZ family protein [Anaerolineales bacterium HSG24]
MNNQQRFLMRWPWLLLTLLTTLWLLYMTLYSWRYSLKNDINLIPLAQKTPAITCLLTTNCTNPLRTTRYLMIDVVGNVVVFIPLGLGLAGLLHQKQWQNTLIKVMASGFILSLTIEILQLMIPSRASDVDDLIFNTSGAAIGAFIYLSYRIIYDLGITRWQETAMPKS